MTIPRGKDVEGTLTADEILNAILPSLDGEDPPSSFTQTGHLGESSPGTA